MAKKLTPLGNRVVVKAAPKEEEKTKSGIILPNTGGDKEKVMEGTVIAVGTGRYLENGQKVPLEVKVGDKILFDKFARSLAEVWVEGEEFS